MHKIRLLPNQFDIKHGGSIKNKTPTGKAEALYIRGNRGVPRQSAAAAGDEALVSLLYSQIAEQVGFGQIKDLRASSIQHGLDHVKAEAHHLVHLDAGRH